MPESLSLNTSKKLEDIKKYIGSVTWVFAKTYARTAPHEYTVKEWGPENGIEFDKFVKFIRANGYKDTFWGSEYTYYDIDGWKYWAMGEPIKETTLINRSRAGDTDEKN